MACLTKAIGLFILCLVTLGCRLVEPPLNRAPSAAFSWKPAPCPCPNLEITFTADAEDEDGGIKSIEWDFGDNGRGWAGTGTTVVYRYAKPDRYLVTLTVRDTDNYVMQVPQWVEVN